MGTLRSVNVGTPKEVPWHGRSVYTAVWKAPVGGPVHEYRDLWIIRFAEDGRCRHFEEWPYAPDAD